MKYFHVIFKLIYKWNYLGNKPNVVENDNFWNNLFKRIKKFNEIQNMRSNANLPFRKFLSILAIIEIVNMTYAIVIIGANLYNEKLRFKPEKTRWGNLQEILNKIEWFSTCEDIILYFWSGTIFMKRSFNQVIYIHPKNWSKLLHCQKFQWVKR